MEVIKKIAAIILRIGISIVLLIVLFRQVDIKGMFGIVKSANPILLLLAFLVMLFCYILSFFRWKMLLDAINIKPPAGRVVLSFAGGLFFNLFLPSTIGGDIMRSLDLSTHTNKPKEVIATVFLDRLSGYVGLVLLASTALILGWHAIQVKAAVFSVIIITLILVAILVVLFNNFVYKKLNKILHSPSAGKIRELITSLHQEIHLFRHRKGLILKNILVSVLIQGFSPVSFYIVALSLGIKVNIIYFILFFPIIGAITMLPISIGGLGLRDATTVFFFSRIGVAKDLAFATSLLGFFFIFIIGILGGIIYVFTVHNRRIQRYKSPSL